MDDSPVITGTWQVVRAELAGEEMPEFVAGKIEVELTAGTYTVRFAGEVSDHGTYALESAAEPKKMLLSGVAGTNAGRTIPAIYEIGGGELRICYGLDGSSPSVFATSSGKQHYLATYQRKSLREYFPEANG